jgi:hypothetical protein
MPVHDWTRVSHGTFHDFHYSWVLEIKRALKRGLLPDGYYVMAEQVGGDLGAPDVLTHARSTIKRESYARLQRSVVVRHTSDDRIVAMIEILSAGNKSSRHALRSLLDKVVAALDTGVHRLLVDVHPPGPRDPHGVHRAVLGEIGTEDYLLPGDRPPTADAYIGGTTVEAFVKHFAVGDRVPEMPLFLTCENYVRVPLEAAYLAAWQDVPAQYQKVLEAPAG